MALLMQSGQTTKLLHATMPRLRQRACACRKRSAVVNSAKCCARRRRRRRQEEAESTFMATRRTVWLSLGCTKERVPYELLLRPLPSSLARQRPDHADHRSFAQPVTGTHTTLQIRFGQKFPRSAYRGGSPRYVVWGGRDDRKGRYYARAQIKFMPPRLACSPPPDETVEAAASCTFERGTLALLPFRNLNFSLSFMRDSSKREIGGKTRKVARALGIDCRRPAAAAALFALLSHIRRIFVGPPFAVRSFVRSFVEPGRLFARDAHRFHLLLRNASCSVGKQATRHWHFCSLHPSNVFSSPFPSSCRCPLSSAGEHA